jgi:hypothetical protein
MIITNVEIYHTILTSLSAARARHVTRDQSDEIELE